MLRRAAVVFPLVAFLAPLLAVPPARAWTPATSRYVAENAARLMPTTLRAVLYTHREELFAGARTPGSDEESPAHHAGPGDRHLQARIVEQVRRVERMLEARAPFREVVREMGVLAHFVADAQNPLHVSDDDPREETYHLDYARYVERNLEKFPLVFGGYRDAALARGDVAGFVDGMVERSRRRYPRIGQDYYRKGRLVSSDVFDEYSFAFGVGALSISGAVADTGKIWLHLWENSGGDIDGLPYPDTPPAGPTAFQRP